jgi:hypothetical protein
MHLNCFISRQAIKSSNTEFFRNKSEVNKNTENYREYKSMKKSKKGKRQSVIHLAKIKLNFNLNMLPTGDQACLNAV